MVLGWEIGQGFGFHILRRNGAPNSLHFADVLHGIHLLNVGGIDVRKPKSILSLA